MSRPDRPYRATVVGHDCTFHYDYPTKEKRADAWATSEVAIRTTVTSRKPVKRGEPVAWVNVYAQNAWPDAALTKDAADRQSLCTRTHCIPVYLPGEGAEPVTEQMREAAVGYYLQHQKDRQRMGELESEVERLTKERDNLLAQRDAVQVKLDTLHAFEAFSRKRADKTEAEVERLKAGERQLIMERDAAFGTRDTLRAEVELLTKELSAAQAQAMPAGLVVYGARRAPGHGKYERVEVDRKEWRAEKFPKSDGWTWFTRVEES